MIQAKTVLVFLGLKALEIIGCLIVLCVFWKIGAWVSESDELSGLAGYFFPMALGFLVAVVAAAVVVGLIVLCEINWEEAKSIVEKR